MSSLSDLNIEYCLNSIPKKCQWHWDNHVFNCSKPSRVQLEPAEPAYRLQQPTTLDLEIEAHRGLLPVYELNWTELYSYLHSYSSTRNTSTSYRAIAVDRVDKHGVMPLQLRLLMLQTLRVLLYALSSCVKQCRLFIWQMSVITGIQASFASMSKYVENCPKQTHPTYTFQTDWIRWHGYQLAMIHLHRNICCLYLALDNTLMLHCVDSNIPVPQLDLYTWSPILFLVL